MSALKSGLRVVQESPAPCVEATAMRRILCLHDREGVAGRVGHERGGLTGLAHGLSLARELFSALTTASAPSAARRMSPISDGVPATSSTRLERRRRRGSGRMCGTRCPRSTACRGTWMPVRPLPPRTRRVGTKGPSEKRVAVVIEGSADEFPLPHSQFVCTSWGRDSALTKGTSKCVQWGWVLDEACYGGADRGGSHGSGTQCGRTDGAERVVVGPCTSWPEDSAFIREVLDRIGDKWTVLVLSTLGGRALRYSDLQASIPGISQRMLTVTLKALERDGLVARQAYAEMPPRVEYEVTELGRSLQRAVLQLSGGRPRITPPSPRTAPRTTRIGIGRARINSV